MATEVADLFIKLSLLSGPLKSELQATGVEGESLIKKMGGIGPAMTKVGGMVAAAGVGLTAVSVKMAGDWQQSMTKLVTSAGETGDVIHGKLTGEIASVSDQMLKMAVSTGTSTKSLADAMYYVESGGYHAANGINVLRIAAQGAKAEGADVTTVADALTTALRDMGDTTGKTAVPMMNQMIAAVGSGKMTMEQFAGSLHSVLPQAHAAGLSFAEVGGAVATMTAEGTSADQSTQMLGHTISSLQTPNQLAVKWMNQMGLSSVDLQEHLGERGLTGTLTMINQAIMDHMGPDGQYLVKTFAQSKDAAAGLQTMLQSMPTVVKNLSTEVINGVISTKDYNAALKSLSPDQQAMGSEFLTNYKNASSFNLALRGSGTDVQTYAGVLRHMLGDQVDTNTALQIGGLNLAALTQNVQTVSDAFKKAGNDISTWGTITQGFNFKIDQLRQDLVTTAIRIGSDLIPKIESVIDWMTKHKTAVRILAEAITGLLLVALGMWIKAMTTALIKTIAEGSVQLLTFAGRIIATSAVITMSMVRALVQAAAAIGGFILKLLLGDEVLDAMKLKLAAAGIGMQTLTAETEASTTAAETAAGVRGIGGLASKIGGAIPIIGGMVAGGLALGSWMEGITKQAGDASVNVDQFTTAMMNADTACNNLSINAADAKNMLKMLGVQSADDAEPMAAAGIAIAKAGQMLGDGAQATQKYDGALAQLVASGHADRAAALMEQITAATDKNGKALINTAQDFPQYFAALDRQAAQQATAVTSTTDATSALNDQVTSLSDVTGAANDTATALGDVSQQQQDMTAGIEGSKTLDNYTKQLENVKKALQDNGAEIKGNSDAALANRDALRNGAQAIVDNYNWQIKMKVGIPQATQTMKDQIQQLINTSSTSDKTRAAVKQYLDTLDLIPPDVTTNLNLNTSQAKGALTDIQKELAASGVAIIGGNTVVHGAGQSRAAGFADGGYVPGAKGAPMLAVVHGGEYVLSNDMLDGTTSIGASPSGTPSGGTTIINNIQGSVLTARDLRDLMQTQMLQQGGRFSSSYPAYKR
jgi:TP901 family phage tail tape measure protein